MMNFICNLGDFTDTSKLTQRSLPKTSSLNFQMDKQNQAREVSGPRICMKCQDSGWDSDFPADTTPTSSQAPYLGCFSALQSLATALRWASGRSDRNAADRTLLHKSGFVVLLT